MYNFILEEGAAECLNELLFFVNINYVCGVSMEQKLAEFRARRQTENAAKKSMGAATQSREQTEETSTADSQQPEQRKDTQAAASTSQSKVRGYVTYWKVDKQFTFTVRINIVLSHNPAEPSLKLNTWEL